MNYDTGDIVKKRHENKDGNEDENKDGNEDENKDENGYSSDNDLYLYLGKSERYYLHNVSDEVEDVMKKIQKLLGWFTPFPIEISRKGYEVEIPVYLWFTDLFEKVDSNQIDTLEMRK